MSAKIVIRSREVLDAKAAEAGLTPAQKAKAAEYVAVVLDGQEAHLPSHKKTREVAQYVVVRTCVDLQIRRGTLPVQSEDWYKSVSRTVDTENKIRPKKKL